MGGGAGGAGKEGGHPGETAGFCEPCGEARGREEARRVGAREAAAVASVDVAAVLGGGEWARQPEDEAWDPQVDQQGCGALYNKLEECLGETDRDFRACRGPLQAFRECYDKFQEAQGLQTTRD